MRRTTFAALLLMTVAPALAQTRPAEKTPISGEFTMRPTGVIDLGDVYIEVNYYDAKWVIAQQHDRFAPTTAPMITASQMTIPGILTTPAGPAKYTQSITAQPDGLNLSAEFVSDKPLDTNELSMTFILPVATFGGREMKIDGVAQPLPLTPATKGMPRIFDKDAVREIEVPTPQGTLVVSGQFKLLLNDDREWNDPRYSLRLYFTPGSGAITRSAVDLKLRLKKTP
ncbi:MAG TPA: hypothetical protein VF595_13465 [Tepidisphaeraceae bacterium]